MMDQPPHPFCFQHNLCTNLHSMRASIRTAKSGRSSSRLEQNLPAELWQRVAEYLSGRELENAAFLHPSLSDLAKTFKYRETRIDLSFSPYNSHWPVAKYSLKSLAQLSSTGNSHRIQILRIGHYRVSSTRRWISKVFGELSTNRLFPINPWRASPNILRDFTGIKVLYIDMFLLQPNDLPSGTKHPFMSWIWEHIGSQLTTLSVEVQPTVHILSSSFPDQSDLSGLLPSLQVMELQLFLLDVGERAPVSSHLSKSLKHIATLYARSASLKCLRVCGYETDRLVLSALLPLEAVALPSLESFSFLDSSPFSTSLWTDPVGKFIALHSEKLKVLRLSSSLPCQPERNSTQWLSRFSLPGIVTLELQHTSIHTTLTEITDILQPPILITQSLKRLTLDLGSDCFGTILPYISAAAPQLKSLHIKSVGILSIHSVLLLAHHFPNLYTLCFEFIWFSIMKIPLGVGKYEENMPDSFINNMRRSKEEDLLNWKLFDISLLWIAPHINYDPSLHLALLEAFATPIPSIESFHGEGDKFGIFSSPYGCYALATGFSNYANPGISHL
ncbi:hypothetical protein DL96DRAFT_1816872 [Flagelloscypha sp. PMI_526]|nr:hypothetical protein DL96DRAFT_1816872 [Flagelloscypha sp. PMI_526]